MKKITLPFDFSHLSKNMGAEGYCNLMGNYYEKVTEKSSSAYGAFTNNRNSNIRNISDIAFRVDSFEYSDDGSGIMNITIITSPGFDSQGIVSTKGDELALLYDAGMNFKFSPTVTYGISPEIYSIDLLPQR